jgi:hypothetical protein
MRTDHVCQIGHIGVNDVFLARIWNSARPRAPRRRPARRLRRASGLDSIEGQNRVWAKLGEGGTTAGSASRPIARVVEEDPSLLESPHRPLRSADELVGETGRFRETIPEGAGGDDLLRGAQGDQVTDRDEDSQPSLISSVADICSTRMPR